jgi:hypothetical protein
MTPRAVVVGLATLLGACGNILHANNGVDDAGTSESGSTDGGGAPLGLEASAELEASAGPETGVFEASSGAVSGCVGEGTSCGPTTPCCGALLCSGDAASHEQQCVKCIPTGQVAGSKDQCCSGKFVVGASVCS